MHEVGLPFAARELAALLEPVSARGLYPYHRGLHTIPGCTAPHDRSVIHHDGQGCDRTHAYFAGITSRDFVPRPPAGPTAGPGAFEPVALRRDAVVVAQFASDLVDAENSSGAVTCGFALA